MLAIQEHLFDTKIPSLPGLFRIINVPVVSPLHIVGDEDEGKADNDAVGTALMNLLGPFVGLTLGDTTVG